MESTVQETLQQTRRTIFNQLNSLDQFILSRWAYSIGEPIITDPEYTVLLNAVKSEYPNSEYVNRSWSSDPCPV